MRPNIFWCALLMTIPGLSQAALQPDDLPLAAGAVAYGHERIDAATGLVLGPANSPNVPEASLGDVAACVAYRPGPAARPEGTRQSPRQAANRRALGR